MNSDEIKASVTGIFKSILGDVPAEETKREEIPAWDSLKHMQIIFAVEDEFDIQFSEEQIEKTTSIQDILEALTHRDAT